MPISFKHNCIFVHIPKTGGTSIEHALEIPRGDFSCFNSGMDVLITYNKKKLVTTHAPAQLIKMFFPSIFTSFVKFTVVRNPYNRIVSQYFFNAWMHKFDVSISGFRDWVRDYYSKPIAYVRSSQYDFIYHNGVCLVDKIIKFENLENEFNDFCTKFNINAKPLTKQNVSNYTIDKKDLLTEENKEFIYSTFKIDFETFNYQP